MIHNLWFIRNDIDIGAISNRVFYAILARAATDEVHAFIPSLDVWQQMAPMGQARFLHSSAALDGYLVSKKNYLSL